MLQDHVLSGVDAEAHSPNWSTGKRPSVSVHIASYRRGSMLGDLFAALEDQDMPRDEFEVVFVDDASGDATWNVLRDLTERSPMQVRALRLATNSGPATARNTAVAASTAEIVAFTDDDCVPAPGWLSSLTAAVGEDAIVVQGRVLPPAEDLQTAGPWDHTIRVDGLTPFFETCNIAYRRSDFEAVGGFDTDDPLLHPGVGQHFGEDVVLGWRVVQRGADRGFAPDAVVYHRCISRTLAQHLRAQRKVEGFPGLARRSPIFASYLRGGVFLTRRSAAFDLAVVSVGTSALVRSRLPLLGAVPWMGLAWQATRQKRTRRTDVPSVLLGIAATDLVTLVSLVAGSARHRRIML